MKKLACLMVVAALLAVMMVPAFAADGINTNEQKIIDFVKTGYTVDGTTITVTNEYFTALEKVFATVDLTDAQYNEIKAILDEALAYVKANNLTEIEDIAKTNSTDKLLGYAEKAFAVIGYKIATEGSITDADHGTIIITDANGAVVVKLHPAIVKSSTSKGVIKKTGADFSAAAVCGASAVAVLAAASVALKKFRKDNED